MNAKCFHLLGVERNGLTIVVNEFRTAIGVERDCRAALATTAFQHDFGFHVSWGVIEFGHGGMLALQSHARKAEALAYLPIAFLSCSIRVHGTKKGLRSHGPRTGPSYRIVRREVSARARSRA